MRVTRAKSSSNDGKRRKTAGDITTLRRPVTPAEVLRERLRQRPSLTQERLAQAMGITRYSVNQLMNGRRGVTAVMALRLAKATSTTAEFWLDLQQDVDLFDAREKLGRTSALDYVEVVLPAEVSYCDQP